MAIFNSYVSLPEGNVGKNYGNGDEWWLMDD